MTDALAFWLLLVAVGLAGLPFSAFFFARLPGRGLTLARALALLLAGYPLWLLAGLDLVPYERWSAIAGVAAVVVAGALLWRRAAPLAARTDRRLWLAGEALFAVTFLGWTLLHSFAPDVWQTEKPMDMAIVNAINRSESFPPHDPWLAGADLNYYYFGHYLVAQLVRVLGLDPEVGFNLAVPLFYALSATSVFAVASALFLSVRSRARSPILPGLAAAVLAVGLGNLAGARELLDQGTALSQYDWWAPSRVIEGTANEFPFFSFLLADLHAHMLAAPFALVALAFALQLARAGPRGFRSAAGLAELLLASLVIGSLYAINSLDFPTAIAIGLLALVVWVLDARGRAWALLWAGAWIAAAVLLFLPFWLGFSPTTNGVGVVGEHAAFSRFAADIALIYGLPLWVVAAVFAERLSAPFRYLAWGGVAAMVALVLLSPPHLAGLAVSLTLAAFALFVSLAAGPSPPADRFVWVVLGVALGLLAVGELVYIRDVFDGTASFRFNTVFKAGYQAWFLFSVVAGCAIFWTADRLRPVLRAVWLGGLAALAVLCLAYPVAAAYSRSDGFSGTPTLDGLRWLEQSAPGDAAAIRWLRANVDGAPVVLEAVGADFDPEGRGRVSTFTGLPTVLAWGGHEVQWGHDPRGRGEAVQEIYRTRDARAAARLLDRYGVRYVFVGSLERRDFPAAGLAKFRRLGRLVFRSGETRVYRV